MLSDCYFLPDPGLSEKLENLELNMSDVCEPAAEWVHSMRKEFEGSANLEPLKIDFSKLFVGPYKLFAAPYGSVYLDSERQVMGDSTLDVKTRYREAGLDTAKNFKDAPDHISAELEFMYYLIFKEIEAFSKANSHRFCSKTEIFSGRSSDGLGTGIRWQYHRIR
jgi:TorA maturation chaperone TorD